MSQTIEVRVSNKNLDEFLSAVKETKGTIIKIPLMHSCKECCEVTAYWASYDDYVDFCDIYSPTKRSDSSREPSKPPMKKIFFKSIIKDATRRYFAPVAAIIARFRLW